MNTELETITDFSIENDRKIDKNYNIKVITMKDIENIKEEKLNEIMTITENIFSSSNIDLENKIIKDVVILGRESKNNRKYSAKAMREAVSLFENSPAFFEHKEKKEVKDLLGQIKNVREDGNYVKGDLHLLENQSWLLDMAKRMPDLAGFSINANGIVKNNIVESLTNRISVDLVTNPATVKNLFESEDKEKNVEEIKKLQEDLLNVRKDFADSKAKADLLEQENIKLKEEVNTLKNKEKKQKYITDITKKLNIVISESMNESLFSLEDEKIKSILEEIKTIQENAKKHLIKDDKSGEKVNKIEEEIIKNI